MLGHDFSVLDYFQVLCCNFERALNEMPVESAAGAAPFNHLIPTVWHIYYVHTHTHRHMHLLLRGSKRAPSCGGKKVLKSAS